MVRRVLAKGSVVIALETVPLAATRSFENLAMGIE